MQVLQWFWFGTAADQTYESCVDFVVGGAAAVAATPKTGEATTSGKNSAIADAAARLQTLSRFRLRV
jgi:hypothetical protein